MDRTRHPQRGRSSREFLDGERVVKEIGLLEGDVFLDAGCGDGHIALAASSLVGKGKVYAIDLDEESIDALKREMAGRGIKNVAPMVADLEKIPLPEASVDSVLMANVVHGFGQELGRVAEEIARVMRPGSTMAVVEFKKEEGLFGPPMRVRLYPEEVVEMMGKYGFEETRTADVGRYHYAVLLRKAK